MFFTNNKINSLSTRIFKGLLTVGVISLVIKPTNLLQEIIIATKYGISSDLDAFFIALIVPVFGTTLASHTLNAAIIPTLVETKIKSGETQSQIFLSNSMFLLFSLSSIVVIFLYVNAQTIISLFSSELDVQSYHLSIHFFKILIPIIFFGSISIAWSSILNSENCYHIPAISPGFRPLLVIFCILTLNTKFQLNALAYGFLAGYIAEFIFLGIFILRVTTYSLSGLD